MEWLIGIAVAIIGLFFYKNRQADKLAKRKEDLEAESTELDELHADAAASRARVEKAIEELEDEPEADRIDNADDAAAWIRERFGPGTN